MVKLLKSAAAEPNCRTHKSISGIGSGSLPVVAEDGLEPPTSGYEPDKHPLLYSAMM